MAKLTIDTTVILRKFEENPAALMAAAGAVAVGISKLMNASTARKNAKTWSREVKRRSNHKK